MNPRFYPRRSPWILLISLVLLAWPLSVLATAYHTISIDGTNDFAADEAIAGTNGSTWYFTWDADYFYFGTTNDNVDDNDSNKWVVLYIDTDPQVVPTSGNGTSTGVLYNTQQPTLPFNADFHFRWKTDNTYTNLQRWNGTAWVDGDQANVTAFQNGTFVEFRIPRSNLGNPSAIYVVGSMLNEMSGGEYTYYMVPNTNSEGYDANFTRYLGFVLADQIAPNHPANNDCRPAQPVTSTADSGAGTLRDAIQTACHGGTITFTVNGVITLTTGQLPITRSLTISGPGANLLAVSGNNASRVITITQGVTVTLSGLTFRNGNAGVASGGAIYNNGALSLTQSVLYTNTASIGGGLYNAGGVVDVDNCVISDNVGSNVGGGLYTASGVLNITRSAIQNNRAIGDDGGGVYNYNAAVIMDTVVISGNSAADDGGGVRVNGEPTLTRIRNSAIINNTAGDNGGGVRSFGATSLAILDNVTLSGNRANGTEGGALYSANAAITMTHITAYNNSAATGGGGMYVSGTLRLHNSIVAGNSSGTGSANCTGSATLFSLGYNLESGTDCGLTDTTDLQNTDPLLGPLQDNGGTTWTHAPLPGSPAGDRIPVAACPLTTDQRGVARPVGTACDVGAHESDSPELGITKVVFPPMVMPGALITYTLAFSNSGYITATNAVLTDIIPVSLTVQSVLNSGVTLTDTGTMPPYVWTVAPLAPGQTGYLTITAILSPALPAGGWITNTATIAITATEFLITNNETTAAFYVPEADLTLVKTVTPTLAAPGETVTYTLVFSNAGPDTATGVVLADLLPTSVTVQGISSSGVPLTQTGSYVWQVADLAPGAGGVVTITATVDAGVGPGQLLTNTATILGAPVDPQPADNGAVAVFVTPNADLTVLKEAWPEPAVAGTWLHYTITVQNQGPQPALGVQLTDTLPLSLTLGDVDQWDGFGGDPFAEGATGWNILWHPGRPQVADDNWLELDNWLLATGVYTSRVMDAYNAVNWGTLNWTPRRPYGQPLPDNGQTETVYDLGNATMIGNRLLLHLDTAGPVFTDTSGLGLHGVCPADLEAGESCPTTTWPGIFGDALAFDGTLSQTLVVTDTADPSRFAVELWVYPTVVTDTSFILRTDLPTGTVAAAHASHLLGIADGNFVFRVYADGWETLTGPAVVTNTWYHLAATAQSDGSARFYVNGEEVARRTGLGTLWQGGDFYRLGSAYGPTTTLTYFSGALDEVAIYSRTLSAAEISDHYLRGVLGLAFQVRGCADPTCAGVPFVGPGGLLTTTYTARDSFNGFNALPAVSLSEALPGTYRYFQYRAVFTGNGEATPQLRQVSVGPAHRAISSTVGTCLGTAQVFTCTLGDLAPGGTVTITTDAWINAAATLSQTNLVTVTAATPGDADLTNNTAAFTSTIIGEVDLIVEKYDADWNGGTDPVNPGSPLTYTLLVRNAGPSVAWGVTVTDEFSGTITAVTPPDDWDPCTFSGGALTCTVASLAPTGYRWDNEYDWEEIVVVATAPTTLGIITNTVWVTTTTTELDATDNMTTETTLIAPVADVWIVKTDDPDPVLPGGTLTYTIAITNSGPYTTATNVVVTDTLPTGLVGYPIAGPEWSCSAPGNPVVCTLATLTGTASFQITTTAPLTGYLENVAHVTADEADLDPDNNWDAAYTTVLPVADLLLSKEDWPDPVDAAQLLTYTVTITNAGPAAAGGFTTTLTASNGHPLNIPILAGPARPYHTDIYAPALPGLIQNLTVTLYGFRHDYPADLSVVLFGPQGQSVVLMSGVGNVPVSDLTLTFHESGSGMTGTLTSTVYRPTNAGLSTDLPAPAPAGPYGDSLSAFYNSPAQGRWQLYVYDHVYSDNGQIRGWRLQFTTRTTDTLTLTDTLPSELSGFFVDAPADWTCSGAPDLLCTGLHLAAGDSAVFTIQATAPITGMVITNTASVTATVTDLEPLSNTATITTTVLPVAELQIAKVAAAPVVGAGGPVTYTLTITNAGPSPLEETVTVTDTLPADLSGVTVTPDPAWMCDTSGLPVVTCTVGSLVVGVPAQITLTATAPVTPQVLTNTAAVFSAVTDPLADNNQAEAVITVVPLADLAVVKTIEPPGLTFGAPFTYTLVVTNTGPSVATTVVLTDLLEGVTEFGEPQASGWSCLAAGATFTCTLASLPVGPAPLIVLTGTAPALGGLITNTAAITSAVIDLVPLNNLVVLTTVVSAPPVLSPIADVTTPEDTPVVITFTVDDTDSPLDQIELAAQVSHATLLPPGSWAFGGNPTEITRTLTITPALDQFGSSVVTVTATSQGVSVSTAFTLTVTPVNDPPVAVDDTATTAQATPVTIPVTLNDTDVENDPLTVSAVGTPANGVATYGGATVVYTPTGTFYGQEIFTYTVTDGNGGFATATITVTVNALPVAVVGSDQTVVVGANVTLDGSASYDPDNQLPLTYGWQQVGGPAVTFNPVVSVTTFTAPATPTVLTFTLRVTDSAGLASLPATTVITVTDEALSGLQAFNSSPTVVGQVTAFTATVATGTNVVFTWDFGNGATGTGANPTYTYPLAGIYTAVVTATNSVSVLTATTVVTITNAPPVAVTGPDQTVVVGANVTLDGRASYDPDNQLPLTYGWQQVGGPAVTFNPVVSVTTFTAPATPTVLTFTLRVTDSAGLASLPATTVITVTDEALSGLQAFNSSPTVVGQVTAFTATVATGTNVVFTWDFGNGATGTGANPTYTYPLAGVYTAVVTAANGASVLTATTVVTITNTAPVAVAGPDRSVVVNTVVTLDGSASYDPDSHLPLTYGWQQVGGPAVTFNPVLSVTTFTAPATPTVLTFTLTVTDTTGLASAPDLVVITVSPPYYYLYLPLVLRNYVPAPDLVVTQLVATATNIQVVIKNQGDLPVPVKVENEFWVDVYINPNPAPTAVNQTWRHLGTQGLVWGVTVDALPALVPGGMITLTYNGAYYRPDESQISWPLPVGTRVYAQVDSAHASTTYGAVRENHEIVGGPYNNILGPVLSTAGVSAEATGPSAVVDQPGSDIHLPPRP